MSDGSTARHRSLVVIAPLPRYGSLRLESSTESLPKSSDACESEWASVPPLPQPIPGQVPWLKSLMQGVWTLKEKSRASFILDLIK